MNIKTLALIFGLSVTQTFAMGNAAYAVTDDLTQRNFQETDSAMKPIIPAVAASINQYDAVTGKAYLLIEEQNKFSFIDLERTYASNELAPVLTSGMITVINNKTLVSDTVIVSGLTAGEIVRVYGTQTTPWELGSTVSEGTTATVYVDQLGSVAGSVYVTVESNGGDVSERVERTYSGEPVTEAPISSMIVVTNNNSKALMNDTVVVGGLTAGEIVRVYDTQTSTWQLGSVVSAGTTATVNIDQLGKDAGSIYVTVEESGKWESTRVGKTYSGEPVTEEPISSMIVVTNNSSKALLHDKVVVSGLTAGEIVRVYGPSASTALGSEVSVGNTATVDIDQLGRDAGSVYVTVEESGKWESPKVKKTYSAEPLTTALVSSMIAVTNNNSKNSISDTVVVSGLTAGEIVRVYDTWANTVLGSAISAGSTATININQLGRDAGSIYVTVEDSDKWESAKVGRTYEGEPKTTALVSSMITVTNNAKIADTVVVNGLTAGEIIRVYDTATSSPELGSSVSAGSMATVSIGQLGSSAGSIYVTVEDPNKWESARVGRTYAGEAATPNSSNSGNSGSSSVKSNDKNIISIQSSMLSLDGSSNNAITFVSADAIQSSLDQTKANTNNVKLVTIKLPNVGAESYETVLPAKELELAKASNMIKIETELGAVTLPSNMITSADIGNAAAVSIAIAKADLSDLDEKTRAKVGNYPVIELSMLVNGKVVPWQNGQTSVSVSIPYTPTEKERLNSEYITIYYIDGSGNTYSVPNGRYDSATGCVVFSTSHFSKYAVRYTPKSFDDIINYSWAQKPIEVLASKGVIEGISEKEFAPSSDTTRADFLLLLVKTLGLKASFDSIFSDVSDTAYYYEAVGTAKILGIVDGTGNGEFKPNETILRQDMITMCERALKLMGRMDSEGNVSALSQFVDQSDISSYASDSMAKMLDLGLIEGAGNRLDPKGNSTRAETAVLMYRIYNLIYRS